MEPLSLQEVLKIVADYNNGIVDLNEEVVKCQNLLRESEVVGELENGNVYILKYSADNKLYATGNYNRSTLTYISTYEQYYNEHKDNDYEY